MAEIPYETQAVLNMQRYLRQLSYFDPDIPSVPIDGIYDSATATAVAAFQKKYALPQTGTADAVTWAKLFDEYLRSIEENTRPEPVNIFPRFPGDYSIGRRDPQPFTALILAIQYILRELMIDYGYDPELLPVTGEYDEATEAAIRDFQAIHNLPTTGRVNRTTWNTMVRTLNAETARYEKE